MKKILITNDDGYKAAGILALAREISKWAQVTVVAPERQRSAVSHAITLHKPLRLTRAPDLEAENLAVYFSNGTPSDCVMLGYFHLLKDADLILSGINDGPNMGEDVHYSGTVSAAIEGALLGPPSAAISQVRGKGANFEAAARALVPLFERILDEGLPSRSMLNVNVPPKIETNGGGPYEITTLGSREYDDVLDHRKDPRGVDYFWVAGAPSRLKGAADADHQAVSRNRISVTPIKLDMTDRELQKKLLEWRF